ncbi:helix-turn-helix domain-containing protein [Streptococcus equinus]|uniref:helix-turn-helix domain-containing protein n=1 Tax=Streptococcus equinus TaxID=1335 RepID=UPI0008829BFC|nr:helix-turn-helix transcriptional regulator [Streptococcus equinus]QBX07973.1 hypothetical protein JavanS208_0002 [Streptococcus satellite phage Javan208]QBX07985.1 hypothetical protein JavanS209_0002 [Streptococcus satellite phage Javan209]SDJ00059.1 Transcriptional regulator, contains XRE-family HTH domain [Streptococcus equinus]SEP95097.1 Transcriptional regulator, contains XRE-family HTH domain [Streptococcus equinus]
MNRLKELRKEKGLSQQALANELGVHYRTLQNWENGETSIKPAKAEELAKKFGVNIGYLLGYDEKPYKELSEFVKELQKEELEDIFDSEIDSIFMDFIDFLYQNDFHISDNKILLLFNTLLAVDKNKGDNFHYQRYTNPKNSYSLMDEAQEKHETSSDK